VNTEDAIRRGEPGKYRRLGLPILSSTPLPAAHPATCTFAAALNRRGSGDVFSSPTNQELSDFLNDLFGIASLMETTVIDRSVAWHQWGRFIRALSAVPQG